MNISLITNYFCHPLLFQSAHAHRPRKVLSIMSTMLPHEKCTRARLLTGREAVDLFVNEVFGISRWVWVREADFSVYVGSRLGFG